MSQDIKLTLTVNSVIDNLGDSGLVEGEPEISIFTTDGSLSKTEDGYLLVFTETNDTQSARSEITVTDTRVHLIKTGDIESDMLFSEGEEFNTLYRVGPYAFDMSVKTKRIRNTLTEDGGELQLIYSMNIGGQGKNVRMKITARKAK